MAIPSYTHKNPKGRMAWRWVELMQKAFDKVANRHQAQSLHVMDLGVAVAYFSLEFKNTQGLWGRSRVRPGRLLVDRYRLDNVEVLHPDEASIPENSLDVTIGEV